MRNLLLQLLSFPPTVPSGSPAQILQSGFEFFEKWISRIGGMIAFAGAIKFALATRTEDEKEIMQSVLVMVSGFMIVEAIASLDIFDIPAVYGPEASTLEFIKLTSFIGKWVRRVGALGLFVGSIQFGLAIKDNNAASKVTALKGLTAGALVMAVSGIMAMFL